MDTKSLKIIALSSLKGNWGPVVFITLLYFIAFYGTDIIYGTIVEILSENVAYNRFITPLFLLKLIFDVMIGYTLSVGYYNISLKLSRNLSIEVTDFLVGFKKLLPKWLIVTNILLFILNMGYSYIEERSTEKPLSLILLSSIVPYSILYYGTWMTYFIMLDDNSINVFIAIRKSLNLMKGYKRDLFRLQLSFIGWFLLSVLTLGIGFLWAFPYMLVCSALFYDRIKKKKEDESVILS